MEFINVLPNSFIERLPADSDVIYNETFGGSEEHQYIGSLGGIVIATVVDKDSVADNEINGKFKILGAGVPGSPPPPPLPPAE